MPPQRQTLAKHAEHLAKVYGDRVAARPQAPALVIPTGSLTLDHALREGGWRVGRIHEIVGPPDTGKSTTVISSAREHQRLFTGRAVAYVDMEATFDYDWAEGLGLDTTPEHWRHLYPSNSEDASDMARDCCGSGLYSSVILDSVGGMESKKALAKDAEDPLPGANAQVITRMVKHLASLARMNGVTVILVNQYRAQIGSMGSDVSAGPKAMQHATTTKVMMSRVGGSDSIRKITYDGNDEPVSVKLRARVARSKIVPPGRTAEFWINNRPTDEYGAPGIDAIDEYADLGIRVGAIAQAGAWYRFPGGMQVQGRPNVAKALYADKTLAAAVRAAIFPEEK
jgi:recombination protein RecA